ncbi:MAG: DUF4268 domain-containing protein [Clostridia bacterium]|nr:DUF4268 domain-containing protein [Clostridia bacterium]
MITLGRMKKVDDLRQAWSHEEYEFTPWLSKPENIKLLSDAIGIEIEVEDTESSVDSFFADIVGVEMGTDRKVIIENQIEPSNHTHLGQIITYAAGKDAKTIIWIVKEARPAHRAAIEWLNNHTDADINFFLIEIELWQIDDSLLAPKFNIVEQPNNWTREVKKVSLDQTSETLQARYNFWTRFNEIAFADVEYKRAFNIRKPSTDHWYMMTVGNSKYHISLLYLVQRNEIGVELYISNDKVLFDTLYSKKDAIEAEIGQTLQWMKLPEKKASRIVLSKSYDLTDQTLVEDEINWLKEYSLKFKKVFIKEYK